MERLAVFCRDKSYVLNTFAASGQSRFKLEFFVDEMDYFHENTWGPVREELAAGYGKRFDGVLLLEDIGTFKGRALWVLRKGGIANIYVVKPYYFTSRIPFLDDRGMIEGYFHHITDWSKPYIHHLDAHITDCCNLNCKACSHYSPYRKKGEVASLDNFKKDLHKLAGLFSQVGSLCLLGGEPLLEPELLMAFIKEGRRQLPDTEIKILTNGLLIPHMSDDFWRCVLDNSAVVSISPYKPTIAILSEIEQTLQKWNVPYTLLKEISYFSKKMTMAPHENPRKQWLRCYESGDHYFRNGIITRCPGSSLVEAFDKAVGTNIYSRDDGLDIYTQEDGCALLDQLMAPCKMCANCAIERAESIPWESCNGEPDKKDWFVDERVTYLEKKVDHLLKIQIRSMFPHMEKKQFVCFGGGEGYNRLKRRLSKFVTVAYVCSNDTKEDHPREDGTQEITVAHLQAMDNPAVLITVDNSKFRQQIETQLTEMGITSHMVADDFLAAMEE